MREILSGVLSSVSLNPVTLCWCEVKKALWMSISKCHHIVEDGRVLKIFFFLEHITQLSLCIEKFTLVRYVPTQGLEVS